MAAFDELPANLPISFFCLVHDLGFSAVDRTLLMAAVEGLARDGRLLMPLSGPSGLELSSPMMSSRLEIGRATKRDAAIVFGRA